MAEPIKLLLVEDDDLVRRAIKTALNIMGFLEVSEAVNGDEAVQKAQEIKADLVLMDIRLPIKDGITATRELKIAMPAVKVLMLASLTCDTEVFAAFGAGADGYCTKDIRPDHLVLAIKSVQKGAAWLDPSIAQRLLPGVLPEEVSRRRAFNENQFGLSPRELQVLSLLAEGLSNSQIAENLMLSYETVKSHVSHIMNKLVVGDRTQAAIKAVREGLI